MTKHRRPQPPRQPPRRLPTGDIPVDTGIVRLEADPADPTSITLYLNGVPSSQLDLADPLRLDFEYMQHMMAVLTWRFASGAPVQALHLGGAACALPRAIEAERPGSSQIVAEPDAALAAAVREWFDLPRSPRLRLRPQDGAALVASRPDGSADVVIRDAFAPDKVPAHLQTVSFFRDVRRVLAPGGVYVSNSAGRARDVAADSLLRSELAGLRSVFGSVALIAEPAHLKGRRHGNVVALATCDDAETSAPRLASEHTASLERTLRCLPVPSRLMLGEELARFVGTARPMADGNDKAATVA